MIKPTSWTPWADMGHPVAPSSRQHLLWSLEHMDLNWMDQCLKSCLNETQE